MPAAVLPILGITLNPDKCIHPNDSAITLNESHRQATLKSLRLVGTGHQALAVKFDLCGFPGEKVFAIGQPMHRACDAIVFCQFDGEGYILCCELKSSEPTRHDAEAQLNSAHCFTDYIDSILRRYHALSVQDWKRRYFLFHDAGKMPLSKSSLKGDAPINDRPDRALLMPVQNGQSLYLRKLLGRPR